MIANFNEKKILVTQLGKTPSLVNGKFLQQGNSASMAENDSIELLEGKHKYSVKFSGKTEEKNDKDQEEDFLKLPPAKRSKTRSIQTTLIKDIDPAKHASASSEFKQNIWEELGSLLVFHRGHSAPSAKVAAFDVDNTIIETKSGKKFASGPTDWKFMNKVRDKLTSLVHEGFKIVFLTNQLGISKGKPTKKDFKKKVEDIALKLEIPLLLLAATAKDNYRKPCMGMWDHLVNRGNGSVVIDMKSSMYVGDAAGREAGWMPGKL